jgi:hypothetical protein
MAEIIGNPPSLSKKLAKQWRWVAVAIVIVALAVMSKSADIDLGEGVSGASSGDACRVEVNADVLNVRTGPGVENPSVEQLSRGDVVEAQPETTNGFRKLGESRWVAAEFVSTTGNCTPGSG